jgi:hypothetical protein
MPKQKYTGTLQERRRKASAVWKEKNPDKVLNKRYKERYDITYEEYKEMLKEQNHKCYICGVDEVDSRDGKLCVDHCHTTGKVRKLLCHNCNCGLGHFSDDPELLKKAAVYLEDTDKVKW